MGRQRPTTLYSRSCRETKDKGVSRGATPRQPDLGAGTSARGGPPGGGQKPAAPAARSRTADPSAPEEKPSCGRPVAPPAGPADGGPPSRVVPERRRHIGPSPPCGAEGDRPAARRALSSAASPRRRAPNARGRTRARRETRTRTERAAAPTHGARRLHAAAAAARRKGKAARAAASRHPPAAAPPAAVPPAHWPAAQRGWATRLSVSARDGRRWLPGGVVRVAAEGIAAPLSASRRPTGPRQQRVGAPRGAAPSLSRRCCRPRRCVPHTWRGGDDPGPFLELFSERGNCGNGAREADTERGGRAAAGCLRPWREGARIHAPGPDERHARVRCNASLALRSGGGAGLQLPEAAGRSGRQGCPGVPRGTLGAVVPRCGGGAGAPSLPGRAWAAPPPPGRLLLLLPPPAEAARPARPGPLPMLVATSELWGGSRHRRDGGVTGKVTAAGRELGHAGRRRAGAAAAWGPLRWRRPPPVCRPGCGERSVTPRSSRGGRRRPRPSELCPRAGGPRGIGGGKGKAGT